MQYTKYPKVSVFSYLLKARLHNVSHVNKQLVPACDSIPTLVHCWKCVLTKIGFPEQRRGTATVTEQATDYNN